MGTEIVTRLSWKRSFVGHLTVHLDSGLWRVVASGVNGRVRVNLVSVRAVAFLHQRTVAELPHKDRKICRLAHGKATEQDGALLGEVRVDVGSASSG